MLYSAPMGKEKETYVLGIAGSPRRGGSSDRALDAFLAGVEREGILTKRLIPGEKRIGFCRECDGCSDSGDCVQPDGSRKVYDEILDAAGVVLAVPVFFMGMPGHMKCLVDRAQFLWAQARNLGQSSRRPERKVPGFLIATGSMDLEHDFQGVCHVTRAWFHVLGIRPAGELLWNGLEGKDALDRAPERLSQAEREGAGFAKKAVCPPVS